MSANYEDILNKAHNDGKRGNALLEVALALPNLPAELLVEILAWEFPEKGAPDDDPFTWIPTVRKFGASEEIIRGLVSQVLFYNDYPNDVDGATPKCEAFIRYASRHGALVTKETFIQVIEQITRESPGFILRHFTTISGMCTAYKAEAMPYLIRAGNGVRVIWTMAEVDAILRLPLDERERIVKRLIPNTWNPAAVIPPVRNLAAVYLAIQVIVSGGKNDDLEGKLIESLRWKSSDPKYRDPERAVRLFRWYLKYLAEVPAQHEPWMGSWITPEGARKEATERLVTKCRGALKTLGFRFEHVTIAKHPRTNEERLEVRLVERGQTNIHIHDTRGLREEVHIVDGSEVIIPTSVSGEPLFRVRDTIGWRYEFHPVAPPTSAMEKRAWGDSGKF